MPRSQRHQECGGIYHVTARGVRRQTLYHDLHDYEFFERLLGWIVADNKWQLIAYCVMPNHYHLLIQTTEANLSSGMHRLNFRYAIAFNRRYDVTGHVFERRFHSEPIESDEHLFEAARYIVLNPVRAGICAHPGLWRWSSYSASLGRAPARFVSVEPLLAHFGGDPAAFSSFVAEAIAR
jgi:REP element-mobilizing transposase RayT